MPEAVALPERILVSSDVDMVARRWAGLEEQLASVDQDPATIEAARLLAEARTRREALQQEIEELKARYEKGLAAYAKKHLARAGGKTWEGPIVVEFRWCPATLVELVDRKTGIPFIVKHCPEAIEYDPRVIKRKLTQAFLEKVSAMSKLALVRAGLSVTKPHERVTISLWHPK